MCLIVLCVLIFTNNAGERLAGYRLESWDERAVKTWESAYSGPQNQILKLVAPNPHDAVYSYAKVLFTDFLNCNSKNRVMLLILTAENVQSLSSGFPIHVH